MKYQIDVAYNRLEKSDDDLHLAYKDMEIVSEEVKNYKNKLKLSSKKSVADEIRDLNRSYHESVKETPKGIRM